MEKEIRFRILNKTSKTVTVKLQGKPMEFSWEEFNKKLVVVDKFWAVLNEEEKKKQEEANELVNDSVICVLLQRGNSDPMKKLVALSRLSSNTEKLQELLECTNGEVLNIIRHRLMAMNPFMVNPMFDDETLKRNHMYRKLSTIKKELEKEEDYRPVKNEKNETGGQYGSHTPTFGDSFSTLGELKKKLENE